MMIYVDGYRVASASHRRNWFPYASPFDVVTYRQVGDIKRILDRNVVTQIFTSRESLVPELRRMLLTQGWSVSDRRAVAGDQLLSWRRSIDPASGANHPAGGECGYNS